MTQRYVYIENNFSGTKEEALLIYVDNVGYCVLWMSGSPTGYFSFIEWADEEYSMKVNKDHDTIHNS